MVKAKIAKFILVALIGANLLAWFLVWDQNKARFLEVSFFDVGQGEAILIETPQGHQILIDGGPDSIILEKLKKEMPPWDKSIDIVILTHPESDHLTGLIEVLKRYKVDFIFWTGIKRETKKWYLWRDVLEKEKKEGTNIILAKAGQKITASEASIFIIYPFENLKEKLIKDSNNTSIVFKLVYGESTFLFTGDIYQKAEKEILEKDYDLSAKILKVAHHGSNTSSGREFIEEVSPVWAIISAGKNNPYHHPHPEVLKILREAGVSILRTDEMGDIKFFSDGKDLRFFTEKSP